MDTPGEKCVKGSDFKVNDFYRYFWASKHDKTIKKILKQIYIPFMMQLSTPRVVPQILKTSFSSGTFSLYDWNILQVLFITKDLRVWAPSMRCTFEL